jgi:hypothetical protein
MIIMLHDFWKIVISQGNISNSEVWLNSTLSTNLDNKGKTEKIETIMRATKENWT